MASFFKDKMIHQIIKTLTVRLINQSMKIIVHCSPEKTLIKKEACNSDTHWTSSMKISLPATEHHVVCNRYSFNAFYTNYSMSEKKQLLHVRGETESGYRRSYFILNKMTKHTHLVHFKHLLRTIKAWNQNHPLVYTHTQITSVTESLVQQKSSSHFFLVKMLQSCDQGG